MRPPIERGKRVLAVAATSLLCLVSCSARTDPLPPAPTASQLSTMLAAWTVDQANAYANGSPYQPVEAHFIRFAGYAEWPALMKRCTESLGVSDMIFTTDHSTGLALHPTSDQFQRDRAYRTCTIEYPPIALKSRFKSPRQLDYIYDWFQNETEPCFRSLGLSIGDLPSRHRFLTQSHDGLSMWSPFDNISSDSSPVRFVMTSSGLAAVPGQNALSPARLAVLRAKCPALPPGIQQ